MCIGIHTYIYKYIYTYLYILECFSSFFPKAQPFVNFPAHMKLPSSANANILENLIPFSTSEVHTYEATLSLALYHYMFDFVFLSIILSLQSFSLFRHIYSL